MRRSQNLYSLASASRTLSQRVQPASREIFSRMRGMDSRIRKRLRRQAESLNAAISYVNTNVLRKDLILTYVTLVVFSIGMFYQCIDVLSGYLEYPTLMSVLEEREAAKFPAVTMCLSPWYNLSMVCEKTNGRCTKKDLVRGFLLEFRSCRCAQGVPRKSTIEKKTMNVFRC